MAAGGYPSTFVSCMLERCEGQQIQDKVAKVKEPLGVGITVESNDKKEKHRNSEIEQVIVYMKQLVVIFFFFPLEIGLLEMFMMVQFKLIWVDFIEEKLNTQKLASATVW